MSIIKEEIPIIDVHNHIFPHKVAKRASGGISDYYKIKGFGIGEAEELLSCAKGYNRKYIIISSAATHAKNVEAANDFMSEIAKSDKRFIPFGSFHAEYENFESELARFERLGLRGVKFHTDFQGFPADDERLFPLYDMLSQKKYPVLFHTGDPNSDLSHPKRMLRISENFPDLIMICAHMGGYKTKALAEEYLIGRNVYFDISEWYEYISEKEICAMARRHGMEKILYGSDYPLQSPEKSIERTFALPFSDEEKKLLFYENAFELLKNTGFAEIEK